MKASVADYEAYRFTRPDGERLGRALLEQEYDVDDGDIRSRLDLSHIPWFDSNKDENLIRLNQWLQKALKHTPEEKKRREDAEQDPSLEMDLASPENRVYVQKLIQEAALFLEEELEVALPSAIKKEIKDLCISRQHILKFVKRAHVFQGKGVSGPVICALLKIADCFHDYELNPKLQKLEAKTESFADWLAEQTNSGRERKEMGKRRTTTKKLAPEEFEHLSSPFAISFEGGTFRLRGMYWNNKGEKRIIGKLLRKVSDTPGSIVKDGIRTRIFVEEKDKDSAVAWVEALGFHQKASSNTSGGEGRKEVSLKGAFQGTPAEIQVLTWKEYEKGESGVQHHDIYEAIQNFLVFTRLFASVPDQRYEKKIKELSAKTGVSEKRIRERFGQFFFKNKGQRKWHSYEYESRLWRSNLLPGCRFDQLIGNFIVENKDHPLLRGLQDHDWTYLFEEKTFPSHFSEETCRAVLSFFSSKKGLPVHLLQRLELCLELSSEEFEQVFENSNLPSKTTLERAEEIIDLLRVRNKAVSKDLFTALETKLKVMREVSLS